MKNKAQKNNNPEKKERFQSRLIFLIAAAVFLIGAAGILNRNSNSNKYIGTVFVIAGNDSSELKGYKIAKQYEDKITEYDLPVIAEIQEKDHMPCFEQDSNGNTAVSFTGNYIGDVLYSVCDMNYQTVYTDKTSLEIPAKNEDGYIVSMDVKWGKSKNNVTMRYYFQIKP